MNWQIFFADGPAADWILLTVFHSLWLSLAGFLIFHIWKFKAPAMRSAWCTYTLILLLLLPLLTWFAPRLVIRAQPAPQASITTSAAVPDDSAPLLNELLGVQMPVPQAHTNQWKAWINQFGFLWLAVTLAFVGRLLYGLVRLKGYTNCLREVKDDRVIAILQEINRSLGFRLKPRFFISLTLASPVAMGIRKPAVILPAALYESIGDEELQAILLHELAHIHHSDHALGLLQRFVKALYWWNPFVYSLCNALTAAREEVSDNYSIRLMGSATSYATLLVKLVEEAPLIHRLPCVSGMATPYQSLQTRICKIVSSKRDLRVKAGKGVISAISAAALLMCGVVWLGSQVKIFGTEAAMGNVSQETNVDRPSFEVATVKPSSSTKYIPGGPVSTADYWAWRATTLDRLVNVAYHAREWQVDWQIKGGTPGWIDSQLWDLEGRVKPEEVAAIQRIPDKIAQQARIWLMVRSLLEDRFKLRVEWQTRQAPVYNLVVAKGGPKIKLDEEQSPIVHSGSATPQSSTPVGSWGLPRGGMWERFGPPPQHAIQAQAVAIERLVSSLLNRAGRPVIDHTNLRGLYTFQIEWSEEESGPGDSPLARRTLSLSPAFFTALQEQLGLRLESAKGPVEFLVIKSVQKPDGTK